jgi:iron complex outermembrane receptor protein
MEDSFEYYNRNNGELSAQSPRNPVAQLLQTLIKELMIGFGNFELDYKLHFFPALRAVVNAVLINQWRKDQNGF